MATAMTTPAAIEARRRRFTIDEFRRMGEIGIFAEDDRLELIDGEILVMPPIGDEHVGGVNGLADLLSAEAIRRDAIVSVQNPMRLSDGSAPQPDIALLRRATYSHGVPAVGDVLLVIEIADTSLSYDRNINRTYAVEPGSEPKLRLIRAQLRKS